MKLLREVFSWIPKTGVILTHESLLRISQSETISVIFYFSPRINLIYKVNFLIRTLFLKNKYNLLRYNEKPDGLTK